MAITNILLTTTYQQVSSAGCFVSVDGSIMIGFGATLPISGHPILYATGFVNSPINYNGSYGAMWIKQLDGSIPTNAVVTVV